MPVLTVMYVPSSLHCLYEETITDLRRIVMSGARHGRKPEANPQTRNANLEHPVGACFLEERLHLGNYKGAKLVKNCPLP